MKKTFPLLFLFLILILVLAVPNVNSTPPDQIINGSFDTGSLDPFTSFNAYVNSTVHYTNCHYSARLLANGGYIRYYFYPYLNTSTWIGAGLWGIVVDGPSTGNFRWTWFYSDNTNSTSGVSGLGDTWSNNGANGCTSGKTLTSMRIINIDTSNICIDNITCYAYTYGSMTYSHTWTPPANITYSSFNIALLQQVVYTLNYSVKYANSFTGVAGTVQVYSTGLYAYYGTMLKAAFSQIGTATISNGTFAFVFNPRYSDASNIGVYESIRIRMITSISGANLIDYTETYIINWFNPAWKPTVTPSQTQFANTWIQTVVSLLVPLLFLFLPALILGEMIGISGILAGIALGAVCLGVIGLLPLWAIMLIGLALILIVLFGRDKLR